MMDALDDLARVSVAACIASSNNNEAIYGGLSLETLKTARRTIKNLIIDRRNPSSR